MFHNVGEKNFWLKSLKNSLEDVDLYISRILLSCNFIKKRSTYFSIFEYNCRTTLLCKTSQLLPHNYSTSFLITKSIKKDNTISLFFTDTVGVYCLLSEIIALVFCLILTFPLQSSLNFSHLS